MQGISKKRHEHLTSALLQMERLLEKGAHEDLCTNQAAEYRAELVTMHQNYERLLDELARQIDAYEILYSEVKVQFLGKKLKELKKNTPVEKPAYVMLVENIRLVYGT